MSERPSIENIHLPKAEYTEPELVDYLIEQFPAELQARLVDEIADKDYARAIDLLTTRLINRRFALRRNEAADLPPEVEVIHDFPNAIARLIEESKDAGQHTDLGRGMNGEIVGSIRQPNTCYKVLFKERAKQLYSTAAREAGMQHRAWAVVKGRTDLARVPAVLRYIDHADLRSVHMERIDGVSLQNVLSGKAPLPANFDVQNFFRILSETVHELNSSGIFHRDLFDNPGNVMIDKDGKPCIIDFGSSVRCINPGESTSTYQLHANGPHIVSNDMSGVSSLKTRMMKYVRDHDENHGG